MAHSASNTRVVYQFPERCFIENIAIRSNGHLLLTTFREGLLFDVDPNAATPEPQIVARLPGCNALTGIVEIEKDVFAVAGGRHAPQPFVFDKGTMNVHRVDLNPGVSQALVQRIADAPDAPLLNGMSAVPENPHILLSVDSHGKVWRIDANTGKVDVALENAALAPSEAKGRVAVGANGAKVFGGYLYFTNSAKDTFSRVRIDSVGNPEGAIEVVARAQSPTAMDAWDDFDFDHTTGTAYITFHTNAVHAVDKAGNLSTFAGGGDSETFQHPTSLAVSKDGRRMYVACGGKTGEFHGYVVEVELPISA